MSDSSTPRESLSRTPSWVMLGFVIGCIVTLSVKRQIDEKKLAQPAKKEAAEVAQAPAPTPVPTPHHATLAEMEAVFQRWQIHAVWRNGITEVAFWDPLSNRYSEYVEVLRSGDDFYFRNITKLTRPLIDEGVPPDAPLRFTDPDAQPRRGLFGLPNS